MLKLMGVKLKFMKDSWRINMNLAIAIMLFMAVWGSTVKNCELAHDHSNDNCEQAYLCE